jgi:hypothetical protein
MDCGTESVKVDGDKLLLSGAVRPPLKWAYTITMDEQDWVEFFETAMHPSVVAYLSRPAKLRLALQALWYLFTFMVVYTFLLPVVWVSRLRQAPAVPAPTDELAHGASSSSATPDQRD